MTLQQCIAISLQLVDLDDNRRGATQPGIVAARDIVVYLCRSLTHGSWAEIGEPLFIEHSTAVGAFRRVRERMEADLAYGELARALRSAVAELARMHGGGGMRQGGSE